MLGALSTIPTLGAATLTPLISKSADVFGRPETLTASIASYVLGTALQAKASSMELFCIGTIFWTIGFLGVISMFEIIIADLTSMRLRVVVFYLPAIPYLITTWLSATLRNAIIQACPSVQWRFAWSAILYTACSAPLVMAMFIIERRAKNRLSPSQSQTVPRDSMRGRVARTLLRLRQMDILGWICFVGIVTCLLAPWAAVRYAPVRRCYVLDIYTSYQLNSSDLTDFLPTRIGTCCGPTRSRCLVEPCYDIRE
jgi:SIT family siderophore-iron:H+ symporter-like MFS transporter